MMFIPNSNFLSRARLLRDINTSLKAFPAVSLLGARQVGKSTLAGQVANNWVGPTRTFDLESRASRRVLEEEPETILREIEGLVIIDEIQRMPELFELLRPILDNKERRAKFLLLGSAAPETVRGVTETLTGRFGYIDVGGFSIDEVGKNNMRQLWWRGGLPNIYLAVDEDEWTLKMEAFSRTFVERDISALAPQISKSALERFWEMSSHFHGQIWNASKIGRAMDVSNQTANTYRDLFASTYMLRVLHPWFTNIGKRLIKSPKVYLRDSGVLHYLLGLYEMDDLYKHPQCGFSWEGFALEQTLRVIGERGSYFYATSGGGEIDLVVSRGYKKIFGFEFKRTEEPRQTKSMIEGIKDLNLQHLWVIYPGDLEYPMGERITALPLKNINSLDIKHHIMQPIL